MEMMMKEWGPKDPTDARNNDERRKAPKGHTSLQMGKWNDWAAEATQMKEGKARRGLVLKMEEKEKEKGMSQRCNALKIK